MYASVNYGFYFLYFILFATAPDEEIEESILSFPFYLSSYKWK